MDAAIANCYVNSRRQLIWLQQIEILTTILGEEIKWQPRYSLAFFRGKMDLR